MLSEAKHLVLRKQTPHGACPEREAEILRFAQDGNNGQKVLVE